jgi:hypothetical protein
MSKSIYDTDDDDVRVDASTKVLKADRSLDDVVIVGKKVKSKDKEAIIYDNNEKNVARTTNEIQERKFGVTFDDTIIEERESVVVFDDNQSHMSDNSSAVGDEDNNVNSEEPAIKISTIEEIDSLLEKYQTYWKTKSRYLKKDEPAKEPEAIPERTISTASADLERQDSFERIYSDPSTSLPRESIQSDSNNDLLLETGF